NVDLVARADRGIADRVVDLAHVVDAVVGGGIHLDDVDVPALHDRLAMHADHRHFDGRRGDGAVWQLVIERAGENARRRGLADAAHAGQDPGLRDARSLECIRDGAHHRILADQIIEGRGAILACEHAVGRIARRAIAEDESRLGLLRGVAHNAIRSAAATRVVALRMREGWEADERPEPRSLGLLPSGPDPVGEWLVHPPPPTTPPLYRRNARRMQAPPTRGPPPVLPSAPSSCACLLEKLCDGREGLVALLEHAGKEIEAVRHALANEVLDLFAPCRA